jgi:SAM-dependent methyltransferase
MLALLGCGRKSAPGLRRALASGTFDRHAKRAQRDAVALGTPPEGLRLLAYASSRVASRLADLRAREWRDVAFAPCGPGIAPAAVLAVLAPHVPDTVTLLDISPEMVGRATKGVAADVGGGRKKEFRKKKKTGKRVR